jgi:hypothetical protein
MEQTALEKSRVQGFQGVGYSSWGHVENLPTNFADFDEYQNSYKVLVEAYKRRNLTNASDMLNAFTGITTALSTVYDDKFCWGLPESYFSHALRWKLLDQARNKACCTVSLEDGSLRRMPFPTWSWAAWDCGPRLEQWFGLVGNASLHSEPEITLYRRSTSGELVRINEHRSTRHEARFQAPKDIEGILPPGGLVEQWKGHPRTIAEASDNEPGAGFIDSGILQCWTSTATIYIRRTHLKDSDQEDRFVYHIAPSNDYCKGFEDEVCITMGSTAHVEWNNQEIAACISSDDLAQIDATIKKHAGEEVINNDVIMKDLVIIGRSEDLMALIIEWEDDVAYRLGLASISERDWVKVKNRQWKLVNLG